MEFDGVMVTGGAGFIGSNLVNELADSDRDLVVYAVDNEWLGDFENVAEGKDVSTVEMDVNNIDTIPTEVSTIYHLAALSSTKMHQESPQRGARVNVEGFVNVMEAALEADVDNVVYASSSTVYGNPVTPTDEAVELNPTTRYAASKAAREQYAVAYRELGLNVAGCRFFSTYQGYEHNEGHKGEHGNIISMFADQVANGDRPVIYGDGTQTRDFIHVSDVVSALRHLEGHNGTYNVCTGQPSTFNEILNAINSSLNTTVEADYIEPPLDGEYVDTQCGDPTKLKEETGWEPRMTLEDGIERVCEPYLY